MVNGTSARVAMEDPEHDATARGGLTEYPPPSDRNLQPALR
jgi:hypothetical protein